jgi:hypothetical protein
MAYTGSTAAILSNYDEVLKTYYLPAIRAQLKEDTILSDKIDTNETDVSGKNATIECHYGRNKGTGARADGGALPEADYQKFKTAVVPMRYNYGRVTFSGPTVAATKDEKGAYARVVDTEIRGVVKDLQQEVNRQLWGCGYGMLGRWQSGTSTSIVVEKTYIGATAGQGFGNTFGAKYFEENNGGVLVRMASSSSSVVTATAVDTVDMDVSAITEGTATDTMTVTDPGTPATGTYFCRPASVRAVTGAEAAGYSRLEMMGLRGIVTDTDLDDIANYDGTNTGLTVNDPLQGLAVATYSWWKSIVESSTTRYGAQRALTLIQMQKVFDKVEQKAGVGYGPNLILTTRAIRREYLELMQADRRWANTMELDGGWTALDYNGVPLMVDDDAIDGEIYFLTTKDLQVYQMSDYDWMTKDGAVLSRITGYDAYEAVLYRYSELGTSRRNAQGVLCDISYDL